MTVVPFFVHDCDCCVFVMQREGLRREGIFPAGKCDVYVCPIEPTCVVRNGDEGWEYSSSDSYLLVIYEALRMCGDDETLALAKAVARHGRRSNRKWRSDCRRKRAREMRRIGYDWTRIPGWDGRTEPF